MFELEKLLPPTERTIRLETRKGHYIENIVAPRPSERHLIDYERAKQTSWRNRKPACGYYNCHGLIFAARRTSIYPDNEVWKVLNDDGYRQLGEDENPKRDDIVLYFSDAGAILHVGRVVSVAPLEVGGKEDRKQEFVKRVLSKWNDSWGEDFHAVRDIGLLADAWPEFIYQLWSDRSKPE